MTTYFQKNEGQMLTHTAEVLGDRMGDDMYEPEDESTIDRVEKIGNSLKSGSGALVITGEELNMIDARRIYQRIAEAEMANWVPDASQRLLHRAGHALGVRHPVMLSNEPDCGAEPGWHALIGDWIGDLFIRRCITCCRIYQDGTPE